MGSNRIGSLAIEQVKSCTNVTSDIKDYLSSLVLESVANDRFGKPVLWIGIYVALASLICFLAMAADLLQGLRNRKLWFPCKYFTINAASLTIIAVAMKLPMDLNNVAQVPKVVSMAFMCTIMANFLPSLSTMDTKQLLTNIIALGVLVITLVVNVCIQITIGVLDYYQSSENSEVKLINSIRFYKNLSNKSLAIFYVGMLLLLLIIHICSSLAILKSKEILESKYQAHHQTSLNNQQPESCLSIERLKQLVINHWIMAETGSPQFMTTCSATTSAAGVICAISLAILIFYGVELIEKEPKSNYKWTSQLIARIQYLGIVLGSVAPISRCFAPCSFKMSIKWIGVYIKVFKVERYWTRKLSDWKLISIPFLFRSRKCKVVIQKLIILILNFCIAIQKAIVITCKIIGLLPISFVINVSNYFRLLKAMISVLGRRRRRPEQQVQVDQDLRRYVLQLEEDMELAEGTFKRISKSVKRLIRKAEKQQPHNLMKLVEKSRGFEGVEKYRSHLVPPLLRVEEFPDCWSLTLVTITTIAISLPNIQHKEVERLLSGVSEGLVYVTLVEQSLNATDEYVTIQKAATTLWLEVEVCHKWLGNKLQKQVNTAGGILRWFKDTAKNMVAEVENTDIRGGSDESIYYRTISANLMYHITETILVSYHTNIEEVSGEELFEELSSMISDILVACLTNLPKVIAIKCHTSAIEKREASVGVAAQLLGETTQIINSLQDRVLPSLDPNELPFIGNWRAYFQHP